MKDLGTSKTKAMNVNVDGQVKTIKQEFTTYKITSDSDMKELQEMMSDGIDVVANIKGKDCTYITVRKIIPQKITVSDA